MLDDDIPARGKRLRGGALREAMLRLREEEKLRARDAATRLGVSEAEFVAAKVGHEAIRLQPDFPGMLLALSGVGEVLALTRNEHCVHEKHGTFETVAIEGERGIVRGGGLDLQLFLHRWRHAYKLTDEGEMGMIMTSLQFFDAGGIAVHKVYLTENTDRDAFDAIVGRFMHAEQSDELDVMPADAPRPAAPADGDRTRVAPRALRILLEKAAETATPISVVVENSGAIQSYTGPISKVMATGPWYNILDPRFNMHLHEDAIDAAWVVHEPYADGIVTSLELFDAQGLRIVRILAPGHPQSPVWHAIVASLPLPHAA
ncbi:hemin-degrading factor [Rhodomicrobium sp. Az07]|uniref:ChuX/HutX family heme-like substrate-binding protein n=1 Tax=Rhodomicrobium sp. Az07 TaxID=2839034 RepID=UPI001BE66C4A|nr:ChuX/HutX family heme-like substrate-binding protein [Rhodomicrobium sp. Az07]MBT3070575.1 hemin-degrading factor [Rhodomicrobium sp. Az07]